MFVSTNFSLSFDHEISSSAIVKLKISTPKYVFPYFLRNFKYVQGKGLMSPKVDEEEWAIVKSFICTILDIKY
jgi:hypothetical protein